MAAREYDHLVLSEPQYMRQKKYWLNQLAGELTPTGLRPDFNRRNQEERAEMEFSIPAEIWAEIARMSKQMEMSIYLMLLTALEALIFHYTNHEDVGVTSPVYQPNRTEKTLNEYVVLRNQVTPELTFKELLLKVREIALQAYEHQDYPFSKIMESLEIAEEDQLFEIGCLLTSIHAQLAPQEMPSNIIFAFDLVEDTLTGKLIYNSQLYRQHTIEQFSRHYLNILRQVISNPNLKIAELWILSEAEQAKLLVDFNRTAANYPTTKTIHQLFEEQVERTPNRIAVAVGDQQLTYQELNTRANQLARILREKGVQPDQIVGLITDRSLEMIVGIMGILKAGGAYMPIDPDYPEDRIQYMLDDSGTALVLVDQESRLAEKEQNLTVIHLADPTLNAQDPSNLENVNTPTDLAYIIYTSGTTGKPKGTMIEHKNVVRLMFNDQHQFDFTSTDVWTMFHSMCFDFSVWEMYGALLYGGKLVVIPKFIAQDAREFLQVLIDQKVTVLNQTPSAFYNLLNAELESAEKRLALRYVIFGGEALKPAMLKDWRSKYPGTQLINMYGITETTVHVTYKEITQEEIDQNISNIGRPIPTLTTYIMGPDLNLLPIGLAGELCVGGDGVVRGYLHKPDLTAEKFVQNPYKPEERLYRSGDLARWLPNGELEYLGRIDHQVKIRGYRIELGEIEAQLLKHEDVQEVVVAVREHETGDPYLCAYLVVTAELTVEDLREHLAQELPDYMIPPFFVQLDQIPLTSNGKVDRKALPEPDGSISSGVEYAPPRNEIEERLTEVWADVLGVSRVGIDDIFFSLGGDSIKAIQIASRLNAYSLKMEIKDIFKNPTIRELSELVCFVDNTADQGIIEGEVQLTPIQSWFFEQQFTDLHHFNHSVMLYNQDGFDAEIIRNVFRKIVEHHDTLRMQYKIDGSEVKQYCRGIEAELFELTVVDLTQEAKVMERIEAEANRIQASIDLEEGPLVKLGLFKTTEGDHLLVVIHHLAVDGVSWRIIFEDIATAYEAAQQGEEIQLPAKTHSFMTWAKRQFEFAQGREMTKQLAYWQSLLQTEIKPLPKDREVTQRKTKDSERITMVLEADYTDNLLKNVNQAYNTEINDILLVTLGLAFRDWSGEERFLINLEGHGREEIIPDVDITRTIGWFTSQYPVVLEPGLSPDLGYEIKTVKESLRKIPNKGIGYGILRYLTITENKEDLYVQPEISFNYLGQFDKDVNTGVFTPSNAPTGLGTSPELEKVYAFDVNGMIADGKLALTFSYNRHEYDQTTVQRLVDYYTAKLKQVIDHCLGKEESEITPADLGDNSLSLEELELISGIFDED